MEKVEFTKEKKTEILDIYAYLYQLEDILKVKRGKNNFLDDSNRFLCEDIAKKRLFLVKNFPSAFRNKVKINDVKREIKEHRYWGRSTNSKEYQEYINNLCNKNNSTN